MNKLSRTRNHITQCEVWLFIKKSGKISEPTFRHYTQFHHSGVYKRSDEWEGLIITLSRRGHLVTFSTSRASIWSDVAALFVRCGRSERQCRTVGRSRETGHTTSYTDIYEGTSIQPQLDCQTADCNAAYVGCVGSAVALTLDSRPCHGKFNFEQALRSKCNRYRRRSCVAECDTFAGCMYVMCAKHARYIKDFLPKRTRL